MDILAPTLLAAVVVALIALDATRKINLMSILPLTVYLLIAPHAVAWAVWLWMGPLAARPLGVRIALLAIAGALILYLWLCLNIRPVRDLKPVKTRLRMMMDGRFLAYRGLWAMALAALFLPLSWPFFSRAGVPVAALVANAVYCGITVCFMLLNGALRLICTSRRLGVTSRIIMLLTLWIPFVNLLMLIRAGRLAYEEYDFALYRQDLERARATTDLCKTQYPLVMVHGVLFRDFRYFNYWGRIPKELISRGARVYYGNQEAVGTIAVNARDLCEKVRLVLAETGCDKVNIIAHSKGGLDARYAISCLGLAPFVASLTTISTPHRGCRVADLAVKMPDRLFRLIARPFDRAFRRMGDQNPDFYTAMRQFSTVASAAFNQTVADAPGVYYQSYMTKMNRALGDRLLTIPYLITKRLEGENDGLVSLASAPWGTFRGVLMTTGRRGISHGDIIDLKRQDYKGFDVCEAYIGIAADLKGMGF